MAVFLPDGAILLVDEELTTDVSADLPCAVDCALLGLEMSRGSFASALLDVPASVMVWNNMGSFPIRHCHTSSCRNRDA